MALADGVRFIWLDAYIGQEGQYEGFKRLFRTALDPTVPMPPDKIDSLIRALDEHAAPVLFADSPKDALQLIETHRDKNILFISSGSFGRDIIPTIIREYPVVHRFYFFCAIMENYVDFAIEYAPYLQIFNFELDLLVRLARDISVDIIKQGREYLNMPNEARNALKCFEAAETLNITANDLDQPGSAYYDNLRILQGETGLIQQAKNKMNASRSSMPSENPRRSPTPEQERNHEETMDDDDDDAPIAQQSSDD